jgi:hypothetical protein
MQIILIPAARQFIQFELTRQISSHKAVGKEMQCE